MAKNEDKKQGVDRRAKSKSTASPMGIFTIQLQILWVSVNWKRLIEKGVGIKDMLQVLMTLEVLVAQLYLKVAISGQPAANQPTGFFGSHWPTSRDDKSVTKISEEGKDAVEK